MANWAALQETLIAKPVVKRAKHGIHFQDGKQITAVFSGKPCHYFDGKLWKPIDTKPVLMKNGWFGCPHSDVIIHPDGTVKVGTYEQKASLITAGEGKIDGDRIARPFSGGVQYLYITEDGFRQEIVLEKMPDLKQASALLDTVSGTLPTKYKASALSVKDSATAELADSAVLADAKSLATYLEKAVYPVVIDPDFAGDTADGWIRGNSTTYSTARSTSSSFNTTSTEPPVGNWLVGSDFYVDRMILKFDTSSIGAGSTITQVNLAMTHKESSGTPTTHITKFNWSSYDPIAAANRESAFDAALAADLDDSNIGRTGYYGRNTSGNLSTSWVNKTTATYYGLINQGDKENTQPGGRNDSNYCSANHATESYRPVLTVLYTAASSLHTLSLLGVGK